MSTCRSAQGASQPETRPKTDDSLTYSRSDYAADDIATRHGIMQTAPSSGSFPTSLLYNVIRIVVGRSTGRLPPGVPDRRAPHHPRRQTRGSGATTACRLHPNTEARPGKLARIPSSIRNQATASPQNLSARRKVGRPRPGHDEHPPLPRRHPHTYTHAL